jgi:hypothetical protein
MTATWLIDTATGDLARPLARLALDRGERVLLTGTSPADLAELADLDEGTGRVRLVPRAQGDGGTAAAAVRAATQTSGGLDVLVTAPAPVPAGDLAARLAADLDPTVLLQAVLPELRRRRGSVLHVAPAGATWLAGLHEELAAAGVRATVAERGADRADPDRLARVLVDVLTGGHAPRRLVLGSAALHRTRQSLQGRLQELDLWAGVSRSADPADAPVRVLDRGLAGVLHLAAPAA